jgi:hypothetical protein
MYSVLSFILLFLDESDNLYLITLSKISSIMCLLYSLPFHMRITKKKYAKILTDLHVSGTPEYEIVVSRTSVCTPH